MDITVTTPDGISLTSSADQHSFVTPPSYGGVVISPDSQTAYLTVPSLDEVAALNLETGTFGTPIIVGSKPEGIDITPDGSTLYVCALLRGPGYFRCRSHHGPGADHCDANHQRFCHTLANSHRRNAYRHLYYDLRRVRFWSRCLPARISTRPRPPSLPALGIMEIGHGGSSE